MERHYKAKECSSGQLKIRKLLLAIFVCFTTSLCLAESVPTSPYPTPMTGSRKTDLWHAYVDAARNDPTFQEQLATYLESQQATSEARSVLLPQISLDANLSETYETTILAGFNRYNSNNYSANLTQAIFNLSAFRQLKQAKMSVRAAAALVSAQEQELIVRFMRAYTNVLRARDLLAYTDQQRKFSWRFYQIIEQRHKLRHATITDIEQAKGQYDLIRSEYVTAKINLNTRMQELSAITAKSYSRISGFNEHFPFVKPVPNRLSPWIENAKQNNLKLFAARLDMFAKKQQILALKGNYWPTLQVFGSYSDSNDLSTLVTGAVPEDVRTGVVGLNASWNLFQGGLTVAQVKQAGAAYQRSRALMQKEYLNAITTANSSFIGVADGVTRVETSRTSVESNYSGLQHGEESFKAGTQSIFDILQAQNRLFASQRKYVEDFYNYIIDSVLLKQASGSLCPEDVVKLNHWMEFKIGHPTPVPSPSKMRGLDIKKDLSKNENRNTQLAKSNKASKHKALFLKLLSYLRPTKHHKQEKTSAKTVTKTLATAAPIKLKTLKLAGPFSPAETPVAKPALKQEAKHIAVNKPLPKVETLKLALPFTPENKRAAPAKVTPTKVKTLTLALPFTPETKKTAPAKATTLKLKTFTLALPITANSNHNTQNQVVTENHETVIEPIFKHIKQTYAKTQVRSEKPSQQLNLKTRTILSAEPKLQHIPIQNAKSKTKHFSMSFPSHLQLNSFQKFSAHKNTPKKKTKPHQLALKPFQMNTPNR